MFGILPGVSTLSTNYDTNLRQTTDPYNGKRVVLFVRRSGTRVLLNRNDLYRIAQERIELHNNVVTNGNDDAFVVESHIRLEDLSFARQLVLFQSTAILIAAHGQGCANTIFMQGEGRSALLLVMPQDFFGWHFIYSNSATSVGVHAVVLMRPEDGPVDGWDGSDNDRVNDRRDANFIVREDMFEDGLEIALHKVSGGGGEEGEAQNEVDVEYVRGIETLNF
jgi:hypothetical protein